MKIPLDHLSIGLFTNLFHIGPCQHLSCRFQGFLIEFNEIKETKFGLERLRDRIAHKALEPQNSIKIRDPWSPHYHINLAVLAVEHARIVAEVWNDLKLINICEKIGCIDVIEILWMNHLWTTQNRDERSPPVYHQVNYWIG